MAGEETRFKPGQSGNPRGRPPKNAPVYDQEALPDPPVPAGEPAPEAMLRDLRWAYRNFGRRCRPENDHQEQFRKMLAKDRAGFTHLMNQQEKLHAARVEKALKVAAVERRASSVVEERDAGSEKAKAIYDAWLEDWGDG
jgi:hypothetical protein